MQLNIFPAFVLSSVLVLTACGDGSDSKSAAALPEYDFSTVDARLQEFIDGSDVANGISVTIVDRDQGTVHESALGDHPENIVTLLAGVSMLATVTTVMAIDEDESVDFDIDVPIKNYMPWEGVYGEVTTAQLMSNTSGIPGVFSTGAYNEHGCQYDPDYVAEECSKLIYSTELPNSNPPGTVFDYGGSQLHLIGAVASHVTNSDWNQAFDRYIAQPCDMEVYRYGNMTRQAKYLWTGHPDSLAGTGNPHPGGGAISSVRDMAKLLLLHIREGMCGENRVLSPDAVLAMQVNRIDGLTNVVFSGRTYGMGWWGREDLQPGVIYASGTYGSIAWIDTHRMVGGYVAVDDYSESATYEYLNLVLYEIIPLVADIVDEARMAVSR